RGGATAAKKTTSSSACNLHRRVKEGLSAQGRESASWDSEAPGEMTFTINPRKEALMGLGSTLPAVVEVGPLTSVKEALFIG
ncbi:MAG: hypothetical protein SWE60_09305, partial [Thermodesulfobacteriota bacterium]|nr:hypothetical protein [Thermodesulfobacteriota bacterium]